MLPATASNQAEGPPDLLPTFSVGATKTVYDMHAGQCHTISVMPCQRRDGWLEVSVSFRQGTHTRVVKITFQDPGELLLQAGVQLALRVAWSVWRSKPGQSRVA